MEFYPILLLHFVFHQICALFSFLFVLPKLRNLSSVSKVNIFLPFPQNVKAKFEQKDGYRKSRNGHSKVIREKMANSVGTLSCTVQFL